jgi:hypothetical protein
MNRTHVELTQEQIVRRIQREARKRRGVSARELFAAFRAGTLEDPGDVMDLLSLASLLDEDHELYIEP